MLRLVILGLTTLSCISLVQAQEIDVQSRAKAQADTSVRIGPNGDVSVQSRSKAEAESSVRVGTPAEPAPARRSPTQQYDREPQPRSTPMRPRMDGGVIIEDGPMIRPSAAPLPPATGEGVIMVDGPMIDPSAPPRPRPPLPCKKTIEAVSDDLRITIINNYCTVKITIQKLWREGGKTHVQFEADNAKGGVQANLRMVEKWTDRSGKIVADPIDDQRVAIAKGRNTIFSVSGPTPNAFTGTITLYR